VIIPTVRIAVVAGALVATVGFAHADEAKTPVSATMILDIVSAPVQRRTSAFDESLKRPAPSVDSGAGEVLADGSVRYGRTVITVKNPCPPGEHYEPPPLPGRRAGRR
jgi:hypothetical protein